jgi:hypothetical protein
VLADGPGRGAARLPRRRPQHPKSGVLRGSAGGPAHDRGGPVAGAYQGHFIFTDAQQITAATRLDGPRFSVFEQKARLEIQAGLRRLIEQQAATAPAPAP